MPAITRKTEPRQSARFIHRPRRSGGDDNVQPQGRSRHRGPHFGWGSRDRRQASGEALAREAELFLAGGYPAALGGRRQPVPAYAWLSVLAHAYAGDLDGWAVRRHGAEAQRGTVGRWEVAVSLLARETLTTAAAVGRTAGEVQRSVFVPLELMPAVGRVTTPNDLVALGLRALASYRRASRSLPA